MPTCITVRCRHCHSAQVVTRGKTARGPQRSLCQDVECATDPFLLEPCGLTHDSTDTWGAYTRHLDPDQHTASKRSTQEIARKHLTRRTRITRLVRQTICFSKSTQMHDIVIGLFVNRYAFGRPV